MTGHGPCPLCWMPLYADGRTVGVLAAIGTGEEVHSPCLRVAAAALGHMADELRFEAEQAAKTSRDFGRGMAWAATVVQRRTDDLANHVSLAPFASDVRT